ncbi:Meiotically up-regulated [Hyphodiscus hymeniophilus]|uniref:Meiotically up-regulated n=1 Tax=Hyphodiscus hymeniophilus TaxID=353542 RepID=A0A9P6VLK5_9HELO|nr:Meiotically up-regulated [Hyphodiscus hymeniophilus]
MYTTIEPRLIALLNTDVTSDPYSIATSPSLDLPPLHDPNILKASGRPLLLEPDASKRNGKPSTNSQLTSQHPTLVSSLDEDESKINEPEKRVADRTLGNSSPQSLRKILDVDDEHTVASKPKKRTIVESSKDDFVQLPQPPKKQKAAKQVVPPIIIGLFEPPPQAALFPPIASSSFHDSHGRNSLNTVPPKLTELDTSRQDRSPAPAGKKRPGCKHATKKNVKTRKKWTEEETNNLLLGVSKHGVGSWTDILGDPSFLFNGRSAVDLKDRFRTCCPAELRGNGSNGKSDAQTVDKGARKIRNPGESDSSFMAENIPIDDEGNANTIVEDGSLSKSRKSRAHRKKLEDLAQLGIERPFLKSQRRQRKPFSEQDDHEIFMGYDIYGPSWTRISRDPRFHLQNRTPTDLRDRFRNKFPDKFRSEELRDSNKEAQKPESRDKEDPPSSQPTSTLQPSSNREGLRIQQIISPESEVDRPASTNSLTQSQMSNYNFGAFPEQPVESTDGLPFTQSFDWSTGSITAPFSSNVGEMDISRLLMDESWIDSTVKEKPSFTDINSIITSNSDSLPQVPSFLNMLVSDEQMNLPSSDTSFG